MMFVHCFTLLFILCTLSVDKMPVRHFLTCLNSDKYQTLQFLMFPHQEHVWFIGCVFNTPCPTCAFSIFWSCIAHSHLLHTPLLPLSCIGRDLASSSQHVRFTLCFVEFYFVFGLSFIFSFISHPSCIMIIVRSFISCPFFFSLTPLSIRVKKGESILQSSIPESFVISI